MINYDFSGKYDTLESDALELMGASDVVTFPDKREKSEGLDTRALMKTFFSMISEEEFVQLRKAYDKDYEILGFHRPTYSEVVDSVRSPLLLAVCKLMQPLFPAFILHTVGKSQGGGRRGKGNGGCEWD